MTIKRLMLMALTVLAVVMIGADLLASWNQPQIQSRLELYQTELLLQATEAQGSDANLAAMRQSLLGAEPLKSALEQYQEVRRSVQQNLLRTKALLTAAMAQSDPKSVARADALRATAAKLTRSLAELDLNIGILYVAQPPPSAENKDRQNHQQQQLAQAQESWAKIGSQTDFSLAETDSALANSAQSGDLSIPAVSSSQDPATADRQPRATLAATVAAVMGLWREPVNLLPDAELALKANLQGWFRDRALTRLYTVQQRQTELAALQATEQAAAESALGRLAVIGGLPVLGCLIGVGTLLFLLVQWVVRRKQAILAPESLPRWTTPWDGEIVWQVLIVGFFLVGQLLIPVGLSLLRDVTGFSPANLSERSRSFYILANYIALAAGGLTVLYFSIKPFLPLPAGWFRLTWRGPWLFWGLGGYFAALPLVIVVSLLNQKIWQGQGGSNPILPIALGSKDQVALAIFVLTAAVAAPLFEEVLFRGFLLPSLTRYMPAWGAIALSSLIFAIAHLSLSEVLPLMTLGMILGFVYARSGNLLSSMLLHGLWNSGTLISLFVLGGAKG